MTRTMQAIGAGAGAGAAIGGMTKSQNGVLIGALIGSAGGLVIDQIMKQHESIGTKPSSPTPRLKAATAPSSRFIN